MPSHQARRSQALVDFALRTFGRIDVLFNAMVYFNWIEDVHP